MSDTNPPAFGLVRRRVSVTGRRMDTAGQPASGGRVTATRIVGAADKSVPVARPACILRDDGRYGFLDLPGGDYRIEGEDAAKAAFGAHTAKVAGQVRDRDRAIIAIDLAVKTPPPRSNERRAKIDGGNA